MSVHAIIQGVRSVPWGMGVVLNLCPHLATLTLKSFSHNKLNFGMPQFNIASLCSLHGEELIPLLLVDALLIMFPLVLVLALPVYKRTSFTLKGEERLPSVMQEVSDGVRQKCGPTALGSAFLLWVWSNTF